MVVCVAAVDGLLTIALHTRDAWGVEQGGVCARDSGGGCGAISKRTVRTVGETFPGVNGGIAAVISNCGCRMVVGLVV